MAKIIVDRPTAEQGALPNVCMCCGAPSVVKPRERFPYTPTWVLIFNMLPLRGRMVTYGDVHLPAPLCRRHEKRLWLPFKLKMGVIAAVLLAILCLPLGAVAMAVSPYLGIPIILVFPVALVTVLVVNLVAFYLEMNTPRAVEINASYSSRTINASVTPTSQARRARWSSAFSSAAITTMKASPSRTTLVLPTALSISARWRASRSVPNEPAIR